MQRIAFLPRTEFHQAFLLDILNQAFQNLASQTLPRHFPAAEKDGGLNLVSLVEETQHVILFRFVVVVVHVDTELHFLDRNGLLFFLGFAIPLFVLVQEFPVIHDAANRGLRGWGNLHQVQVFLAGHLERLEGRQDADLLSFVTNHTHFACANALIHADKAFVDTVPPCANCAERCQESIACGCGEPEASLGPVRASLPTVRPE